jgi:hypothetical protein
MVYTKLELYGMGYSSTLDVRTIAEAECGVRYQRGRASATDGISVGKCPQQSFLAEILPREAKAERSYSTVRC